jgi:hypothetical protein
MTVVTKDGRTFIGTPRQIVEAMRSISVDFRVGIREYAAEAARRAREHDGVDVPDPPPGGTDDEMAARFVDSLLAAGLLQRPS